MHSIISYAKSEAEVQQLDKRKRFINGQLSRAQVFEAQNSFLS